MTKKGELEQQAQEPEKSWVGRSCWENCDCTICEGERARRAKIAAPAEGKRERKPVNRDLDPEEE